PLRDTGAPLEAGNILSNEPGFYRPGEYGLRIENLVLVVEDKRLSQKDKTFHRFETLTLCPIDRRLVAAELLTGDEKEWLDAYHAQVLRTLEKKVPKDDRAWLRGACAPIG
ncbi:MAG: M24 family metallopeptidase, partial [Candidatus Eisenbacteria bacterium]|nr:M24 family metallopeptidase [Candidatus Eisenbacteria bacterium]